MVHARLIFFRHYYTKSPTQACLSICARPGLNFIGILRHLSGGPRLRAPVRYRVVKAVWSLGPSAIRKWLEHLPAIGAPCGNLAEEWGGCHRCCSSRTCSAWLYASSRPAGLEAWIMHCLLSHIVSRTRRRRGPECEHWSMCVYACIFIQGVELATARTGMHGQPGSGRGGGPCLHSHTLTCLGCCRLRPPSPTRPGRPTLQAPPGWRGREGRGAGNGHRTLVRPSLGA